MSNQLEKKHLTCISCPMGCSLEIELEEGKITKVSGGLCKRGELYAHNEIFNPRRIVTSTLPVLHGDAETVSIKTAAPIPKDKVMECMLQLKGLKIEAPITIGDVIVEDICNTGINIVATKSVRRV